MPKREKYRQNLVGVPVPPGFTIITDVCNEYYEVGQEKIMELLNDDVMAAVHHIENLMNSKFGDPKPPLLVSVRSGARASMPGMMDTILNLGLNDTVAEGMVQKTNQAKSTLLHIPTSRCRGGYYLSQSRAETRVASPLRRAKTHRQETI